MKPVTDVDDEDCDGQSGGNDRRGSFLTQRAVPRGANFAVCKDVHNIQYVPRGALHFALTQNTSYIHV